MCPLGWPLPQHPHWQGHAPPQTNAVPHSTPPMHPIRGIATPSSPMCAPHVCTCTTHGFACRQPIRARALLGGTDDSQCMHLTRCTGSRLPTPHSMARHACTCISNELLPCSSRLNSCQHTAAGCPHTGSQQQRSQARHCCTASVHLLNPGCCGSNLVAAVAALPCAPEATWCHSLAALQCTPEVACTWRVTRPTPPDTCRRTTSKVSPTDMPGDNWLQPNLPDVLCDVIGMRGAGLGCCPRSTARRPCGMDDTAQHTEPLAHALHPAMHSHSAPSPMAPLQNGPLSLPPWLHGGEAVPPSTSPCVAAAVEVDQRSLAVSQSLLLLLLPASRIHKHTARCTACCCCCRCGCSRRLITRPRTRRPLLRGAARGPGCRRWTAASPPPWWPPGGGGGRGRGGRHEVKRLRVGDVKVLMEPSHI
jgi:hypothetical protein